MNSTPQLLDTAGRRSSPPFSSFVETGGLEWAVEVEFDHPELDYGVLVDQKLTWLVDRYCDAKIKGWSYQLGGCPNLRILKASHGKMDITKTFKRLTDNELKRRQDYGNTLLQL